MRTIKAVLFALLGVRDSREHEQDASQLKLRNIIVVGVIAVLIFVSLLLMWVSAMLG